MTALREGRASSSGLANGSATPRAATPTAATPLANGKGGPRVAEGVQQALLYVKFRTAAEPGLKGLSCVYIDQVHSDLPHVSAAYMTKCTCPAACMLTVNICKHPLAYVNAAPIAFNYLSMLFYSCAVYSP